MRDRILPSALLSLILLAGLVAPSFAWVRVGFGGGGFRGGFRGGFGGPRVGVYLNPWPYWNSYDGYYDPYYAPYYSQPYDPYGYADPNPAYAESESAPARPAHRDIKDVEKEIKRVRKQVDFSYDDGDISQEQHDEEIHRLKLIYKKAIAEADANGGHLTDDEARVILDEVHGRTSSAPAPARSYSPSASEPESRTEEPTAHFSDHRDPSTVRKCIADLRDLLDKKLSGTAITEIQHNTMNDRLTRMEKDVDQDVSANGGYLTQNQENSVLLKLDHAEETIRNNFVSP